MKADSKLGKNIKLPEVKAKAGMDVIQAMEIRAASRSFNGKSSGKSAFGLIVIAADFNEMPGSNKDVKNVAFLSAGSAAQNMYVAGAVYNVQTMTQVSINKKKLKKQLKLPDKVEPLATLTFGHAN